ncbi:histidine--tRNA ligase [Luminiphilus sp.]|nr:histidine--tRNA ligase [Luminiphilus sp.]MDA8986192.1 histidine--tRNA ligase [Luminiphilus sp.]
MTTYQAIRGMVDILPEQTPLWQSMETAALEVLSSYGYAEIRLPIIEATGLFARSIGEVTDIVEKEMYSFDDRNENSMTLRPEGTAGCVRAVVQHNLAITPQKLWYTGPMFRYERPQKGRQRQFHQLGVEAFGVSTPDQDVELIALCRQLWRRLGVDDALSLEINSIGDSADRTKYREALVAYLSEHREALDADSQRRLESNPLRILDSKDAGTQAVLELAPSLPDYLDAPTRQEFDVLLQYLAELDIAYSVNPRLVRGLDYYNKTVFEWTTTLLGAQSTVCGGGRYDGLVALFGGKPTPAAGFAVGLERLILLMQALDITVSHPVDLYVITADTAALAHALPRIDALRSQFPELEIVQHLGGGSFKSQFKRADKSGASLALIYGESELAANTVTLKPLRGDNEQQTIADAALASFMSEYLMKADSA